MTDYITQRYVGMGTYDLQRYYDLLLIMRDYYGDEKSRTGLMLFIVSAIAFTIIVVLFVWSFLNKEWLVFSLVLVLAFALFCRLLLKHEHDAAFEAGYISKVMEAGFSRADATEFLYDIDWDDVQYEESRVEDIRKYIEEMNNVKNQ